MVPPFFRVGYNYYEIYWNLRTTLISTDNAYFRTGAACPLFQKNRWPDRT